MLSYFQVLRPIYQVKQRSMPITPTCFADIMSYADT